MKKPSTPFSYFSAKEYFFAGIFFFSPAPLISRLAKEAGVGSLAGKSGPQPQGPSLHHRQTVGQASEEAVGQRNSYPTSSLSSRLPKIILLAAAFRKRKRSLVYFPSAEKPRKSQKEEKGTG